MSDNNVLILGANGMLGKMVSLYLKSNNELNVFVTARDKSSFIEKILKKNFNFDCLTFRLVQTVYFQVMMVLILNHHLWMRKTYMENQK